MSFSRNVGFEERVVDGLEQAGHSTLVNIAAILLEQQNSRGKAEKESPILC
jgi:hypothetical protein